jgi:dTDP-4-dehydrorhamnose reductase
MSEDDVPAPQDSYGIAKYAVEMELRACRDLFGLNYVIFRPHNVFGPRQNIGDRYRNVVGIFMNQILQGQPMTIFGDGTQTRAFSYIDDVAPMMAEAIDRPQSWNQTFQRRCGPAVLAARTRQRRCGGDGCRTVDSASGTEARSAARTLVSREGTGCVRHAATDHAGGRPCPHGGLGAGARCAQQRAV